MASGKHIRFASKLSKVLAKSEINLLILKIKKTETVWKRALKSYQRVVGFHLMLTVNWRVVVVKNPVITNSCYPWRLKVICCGPFSLSKAFTFTLISFSKYLCSCYCCSLRERELRFSKQIFIHKFLITFYVVDGVSGWRKGKEILIAVRVVVLIHWRTLKLVVKVRLDGANA